MYVCCRLTKIAVQENTQTHLPIRHSSGSQSSERIAMVTRCGGGGAWLEAEGFCELVTLSVLRDSASCGDEEDSTVKTQRDINT